MDRFANWIEANFVKIALIAFAIGQVLEGYYLYG